MNCRLTAMFSVLWDVHNEFRNSNVLSGHKSAVLQVCWANSQSILSCSADKTSALWDANVGARIRRFSEHTAIVNSIAAASHNSSSYLFSTASDDCSTILWDSRSKHSISSAFFDYQQLATALSADGFHLFSAGIDNIIR